MMTKAQFIRDAKSGMALKMIYNWNGQVSDRDREKAKTDERMAEWVARRDRLFNEFRPVTKVRTNSIICTDSKGDSSYLDLPNAKQMDYDSKTLCIYQVGERDLTPKEKAVMDEWKRIEALPENQKQLEYDLLTDGSVMFYKEKRFYTDRGMNYLRGFEEEHGCKYDWNTGKVRDTKVRGKLMIKYEVKMA